VLQASASVTPLPPVSAPTVIDLDVTKTVNNPTPTVGNNVTFTITVSNEAGFATATGVTLSDSLPAGLTFVSASAAQGSYNSTTGVWTIGTIASGSSTTMTIVAHVTSSGTKTNTAIVTGSDQRDVNPDPEASASVTPPPSLNKRLFMSYKGS
jgi:large repetitive protein